MRVVEACASAATPAALCRMIDAVGTMGFAPALTDSLADVCEAEFFALYDFSTAGGKTHLLFGGSTGGGDLVQVNGRQYAGRYARHDPARKAFLGAVGRRARPTAPLVTCVATHELEHPQHRGLLDASRVPDRIALFFPAHRQSWRSSHVQSLHIMRIGTNRSFSDDELAKVARYASIYASLIGRHLHSRTSVRLLDTVAEIEDRLTCASAVLSGRELAVCARIAAGLPSREIARSLGISQFSVQTYRERAYRKLDVANHAELYLLLLGLPAPGRRSQVGL